MLEEDVKWMKAASPLRYPRKALLAALLRQVIALNRLGNKVLVDLSPAVQVLHQRYCTPRCF